MNVHTVSPVIPPTSPLAKTIFGTVYDEITGLDCSLYSFSSTLMCPQSKAHFLKWLPFFMHYKNLVVSYQIQWSHNPVISLNVYLIYCSGNVGRVFIDASRKACCMCVLFQCHLTCVPAFNVACALYVCMFLRVICCHF